MKNFSSLYRQIKVYLWPFIVFAVIIFVFITIDLPQFDKTLQVWNQLSGINERLQKLTAKDRQLSQIDTQKIQADLDNIYLILPDEKDVPSILRNLEVSSSTSGVTVADLDLVPGKIATSTPIAGQNESDLPFKISLAGTLPQMVSFLEKTSSIGRIIDTQNLEVDFSDQGSSSAKINLSLVTYFFPKSMVDEASFANNPEVPLPPLSSKENEAYRKVYQRELLPPSSVILPFGKIDIFK